MTAANGNHTPLPEACARAAPHVLERTFELAAIPAPPLDEADRIQLVRAWWAADGLAVTSQPVGNLWAQLRAGADETAPATVIAAHLDTVFGRGVPHGLRYADNGTVVGPGCGDDSVAVAALAALDTLLPRSTPGPVWIVATVAEEGLGNLAGARAALADPPTAIGAFIALEGNYLGRVNTIGVGSDRRRVRIGTPGGHAWEDADLPSAVHIAAELIYEIDAIRMANSAETSRNAGLVAGGESINSRARQASFDLDLRSESPDALVELVAHVDRILARHRPSVTVVSEPLGSRPAGRIAPDHRLVTAAAEALTEVGVAPRHTSASTDANAAYHVGIPAITLGVTHGDATHTENEWIDPDAIPVGLHALTRTIEAWSSPISR